MAFLDKLKAGLQKTKNALFSPIDQMLKAFTKVDEDLLEELEEMLICADVGAGATDEIIEKLRDDIKEEKIKDADEVRAFLKNTLKEMIGEGGPLVLDTKPSVILVIGVPPPPSPYHPSGSSQCTSPKHPVSPALNFDSSSSQIPK